jgi:hypothetical protein
MRSNFLTTTEARLEPYCVPFALLPKLAKTGSLNLGRPLEVKNWGGIQHFSRTDLEAMQKPLRGGAFPQHARMLDVHREWWCTANAAAQQFHFDMQFLHKHHAPDSPFWPGENRGLRRRRTLIYDPRWKGKWRVLTVFSESDLIHMRACMDRGRIIDLTNGPGLTRAEAVAKGFTGTEIDEWSNGQGAGIPELACEKLTSFQEYRVSERGGLWARTVFPERVLDAVLEARKARKGLSDQEALRTFPGLFSKCSLIYWRCKDRNGACVDGEPGCIHLEGGRGLKWWKEKGLTKSDLADLETIGASVRRRDTMRRESIDFRHKDPGSGSWYRLAEGFAKLAGITPREARDYAGCGKRQRKHPALGRYINTIPLEIPTTRYATVLGYCEGDAAPIKNWSDPKALRRAESDQWLRELLQPAAMDINAIKEKARQSGWTIYQIRAAKKRLSVRPKRAGYQGAVYWCLPGQRPPSEEERKRNGQAQGAPTNPSNRDRLDESSKTNQQPAKKRRGRPKGTFNREARQRDQNIIAHADEYESIAELARAFGVNRAHASRLLNSR